MIYRLIASTDKAKTFLNQMMMKHLLRNLWIVALIVCCNFQQVFAQQLPPIPIDKDVRIGKLDNGLTYYIRKNSLPANRADFYIAQKVGSIQDHPLSRKLPNTVSGTYRCKIRRKPERIHIHRRNGL